MIANFRLPFLMILLVAMHGGSAYAGATDEGIADFASMGNIKPSTGEGGRSPIAPEAIQGAVRDGFIGKQAGESLANVRPDRVIRGATEAQVYKRYSRSVVLVVTRDSLGTGSLINANGDILTNWHVVRGSAAVGVVFKPAVEGQAVTKADLVRAQVVRVDEVADLALIRVAKVPPGVEPLKLGDARDLSVGDDVHAIGHPTGEAWTYTKGVVSQLRRDYQWSSKATLKAHRANVIQTQTPINPGNSGGPLLTSDGKLVGVNSFKSQGEGLNFAIAVDDVRRFLGTTENRLAKGITQDGRQTPARNERIDGGKGCEPREISRGTSKDDSMYIVGVDVDCDGKAEAEIRTPYDIRKPILIVIDENKDTIPDQVIFDTDRDGKWDYSLRDTNFDNKWDLECEHEDGDIEPTRCVPYRKKVRGSGG